MSLGSGWQETTVGEFVKLSSGGTPSKSNSSYWGGEIPWVSSKDMKSTYIWDAQDHITDLGSQNGTRMVGAETVLLVVRSMILAQVLPVAMTKRRVAFNQDLKAIECQEGLLQNFLFHWIRANTHEILGIVDEAGHGTKRIQTDRFLNLPLLRPPLETQKKIAAILSSYDDLIENNTRRIEILEDMARGLYREWFVNFRFPGHEEVEMVDSSLGLVPARWKVQKVADAFEVIGGGTPSKGIEEFWQNGEINWFTPSDLTGAKTLFMDGSENKISRLGLAKSSARLFPPFCVMMTSRATIGAFAINTTEATTNQGFIVMKPTAVMPLYTLYFWARENVELFISKATGTIFKEISKGTFKTIDLVLPPTKITQAFEKIVQPLGAQVLVLQRKNANFRRTRDLLLPKLISGEIDVSTLEVAGVTGLETATESV